MESVTSSRGLGQAMTQAVRDTVARPAPAGDTPELITSRSRGDLQGPKADDIPLKREGRGDPSVSDHLRKAAAAKASVRFISNRNRDPPLLGHNKQ